MRLVMRPDAYPVADDTGAYVLTYQRPVRFAGSAIAEWIDRLAPYLDGSQTLAELTGSLPADQRAMVERVVEALREQDLVREVADREAHTGPDRAELARYQGEIGYLEYFQDRSVEAFRRYRRHPALVVGSGPLVAALAAAGRRSGLPRVDVAVTGEPPAELAPKVALVFQVLDRADQASARQWEARCRATGVRLLQAVVDRDSVWLVEADLSGAGGGGWSAAGPRLAAASDPPGSAEGRPVELSAVAVAAAASRLTQAAFRSVTGVSAPADRPTVTRLDLETLHSHRHSYLPHPLADDSIEPRTEAGFRARVAALERGDRLDQADFSERAARCVDDRLGLLRLDEHDWAQAPMHVTEAVIAEPVGPPRPPAGWLRVIGAGLDYQTARCRAAVAALARYGSAMVDPRRLVGEAGAVWGYELADPALVRLVPAGAVFPALRGRGEEPATDGIGSGYHWQEALTAGLLAHCRRWSAAELASAADPFPRVDLAGIRLDGAGARCRDILAATGQLPEVYEVTGSLGVPTFASCLGDATVAWTSQLSRSQAVAEGLEQALLTVQAWTYGERDYLPTGVPVLARALRGERLSEPADAPQLDLTSVARRLREAGTVAVAVPLDHDPAVADLLPYLVRVVVCDE